jgi:choline dehydrogenase
MSKSETFTQPSTYPLPAEDLAEHGKHGPWQTGFSGCNPMTRVFLTGCEEVGIPTIADFNTSKGMIGASQGQSFIDSKGQRSSTAVAYLTPDVATRPNLKIAVGQTVTKVLFDTSSKDPRALGVEMSASAASPVRYLAKAKKEVLLCPGAVHTPHLLKLSGIGPSDELEKHNIPVVKDLPGVGENMVDHMFVPLVFKSKMPSLQYLFNRVKALPHLVHWLRTGKGVMTTNICEGLAFLRAFDREDAPPSIRGQDQTSGPGSADLELLSVPLAYKEQGQGRAPADKVLCLLTYIYTYIC